MNLESKQENKKDKKKRESYFMYDFTKVTGLLPALIWLRPKVICAGKSKRRDYKGGMLISCNHRGLSDPVLALCVFWDRRLRCLATKDLYSTKLRNWFFNQMHCIQVDKSNFSIDSFHAVIENLKADKAVLIFPEGQVNQTEEMMSFKAGAVLMAHRANKPIVPMYIPEYGKWYNRRVAVLGDPIDVRQMCGKIPTMDKVKEVNEYIRSVELSLKELYETKYRKNKKQKEEKAYGNE